MEPKQLLAALSPRRCVAACGGGGDDDDPPPATERGAGQRERVGRRLHRLPEDAGRLDGRHARAGRHEPRSPARPTRPANRRRWTERDAGRRSRLPYDRARCGCIHLPTGALAAGLLVCCDGRRRPTPIVPTRDDEVIEVAARRRRRPRRGPAPAPAARGPARRCRARGARSRGAISTARARPAIRASPAWRSPRCAPWPDAATAPAEVLLMRATLQQYLHDFDAAVREPAPAARAPRRASRPQAWLTLATVLRVQGRYAESDAACRGVAAPAPRCYARRLPGRERGAARRGRRGAPQLRGAARPSRGLPPATQGWLLTSLAELEERDGRGAAADAAYRRVAARSAPTPTRRSPMPTS